MHFSLRKPLRPDLSLLEPQVPQQFQHFLRLILMGPSVWLVFGGREKLPWRSSSEPPPLSHLLGPLVLRLLRTGLSWPRGSKRARLQTVVSTMAAMHRLTHRGGEAIPQDLANRLKAKGDFFSTQELKKKNELKHVQKSGEECHASPPPKNCSRAERHSRQQYYLCSSGGTYVASRKRSRSRSPARVLLFTPFSFAVPASRQRQFSACPSANDKIPPAPCRLAGVFCQ